MIKQLYGVDVTRVYTYYFSYIICKITIAIDYALLNDNNIIFAKLQLYNLFFSPILKIF